MILIASGTGRLGTLIVKRLAALGLDIRVLAAKHSRLPQAQILASSGAI
jgi:nucleoside-diphosphate-sugar epimerase